MKKCMGEKVKKIRINNLNNKIKSHNNIEKYI